MPARIERLEFNSQALGAVLRSSGVTAAVMGRAEAAAAAAGPGFEAKVLAGYDRNSAIVRPETSDALTALYDDPTILTRAIGAARD
jgi:hypothetical protein